MVHEVLVPQMGESVLEGTILEWKVKVGDRVEINQPLVELMTDKVNIEIPAEIAGVISALAVNEGEVVPVGASIASIDDGLAQSAATKSVPKAAPAKAAAPVAVSSKPSPVLSPAPAPAIVGSAPVGSGRMSPKVRMQVREYGLDPSTITPTGKKGLVTAEDVMRAVELRSSAAGFTAAPIPSPALAPSAPPSTPATPVIPQVSVTIPVFAPLAPAERETKMPLAGARKMISDHMIHSRQKAAHVTTFEDIDMTDLVEYRTGIKDSFKAQFGANITYLPFIIKAACLALREFPTLNASLTDTEIILKHSYNIGLAVARDEGLIVPVIKDADRKSIVELAVESAQLGDKARTNRLMPDDVSGGTFTVTNAGMLGATASTPIIAQPQSAILGIHAIVKRPWVVNDAIVIRHISTFGLSFDHRLIDGHTAVGFLHRVQEYLADTNKLLMHLR